MKVNTSPVTILHRAPYSAEGADDPLIWGTSCGAEYQGQLIEKLMVLDPETNVVLDNLTLHPSINGEAEPGSVVHLECEVTRESKPAFSRGGREYVAVKDKWRVVGVTPVAVAKRSE